MHGYASICERRQKCEEKVKKVLDHFNVTSSLVKAQTEQTFLLLNLSDPPGGLEVTTFSSSDSLQFRFLSGKIIL